MKTMCQGHQVPQADLLMRHEQDEHEICQGIDVDVDPSQALFYSALPLRIENPLRLVDW